MRQFDTFRSTVRWLVAVAAAAFVAAIPTRLASHHVAVGFPFTWLTRQEIVTFGEQPHSFSLSLLLLDIALVLAVFIALRLSRVKRTLKIAFGVIAVAIVVLLLAIILPELPTYRFAWVDAARSESNIQDAQIIDELGDTNGPYRLVKDIVGGVGKAFDFDLTFDGRSTNWTRPVSNHMWFVVSVFENRRGNQFAIVRKRRD